MLTTRSLLPTPATAAAAKGKRPMNAIRQLSYIHSSNLFPVYSSNKLISTKHLLPISTNYLPLTCYTTTTTDLTKTHKKSVDEEISFTVSYLINSFGFSHERAVSVSAKAHFKDSLKPNSVLSLLNTYGFTHTQIATLVRIIPAILVAKQKSISPKLDFFLSIGMSKPILAKFISTDPTWLERSLDDLIIPNYNFLKTFLLTDQRVISAITKHPRVYHLNTAKRFAPNVNVLKELKVPVSCISLLLLHYPEALCIRSEEFSEYVRKVLEMGFDPLKSSFVLALNVVTGKSNRAIWDQCYQTYTSWGWSEEDIYMAFRKYPNCMLMSRNKIDSVMDFLVNKLGVNSRYIAENAITIAFSLEKRIKPRFSVVQVLLSKGLIKRFMLNTVLIPPEKYFLGKFVVPYEEEVPKLYDYYKGKVAVEDL